MDYYISHNCYGANINLQREIVLVYHRLGGALGLGGGGREAIHFQEVILWTLRRWRWC